MSVLEGGIYFQELSNLQHGPRCLLVLGLVMALVGAIFMGVAGFVVERRLAAAVPAAGPKDSFSLVPGAALEAGARQAPEAEASEGLGRGAARSLARVDSSGTVSPRRRAAALSNLRPMSVVGRRRRIIVGGRTMSCFTFAKLAHPGIPHHHKTTPTHTERPSAPPAHDRQCRAARPRFLRAAAPAVAAGRRALPAHQPQQHRRRRARLAAPAPGRRRRPVAPRHASI